MWAKASAGHSGPNMAPGMPLREAVRTPTARQQRDKKNGAPRSRATCEDSIHQRDLKFKTRRRRRRDPPPAVRQLTLRFLCPTRAIPPPCRSRRAPARRASLAEPGAWGGRGYPYLLSSWRAGAPRQTALARARQFPLVAGHAARYYGKRRGKRICWAAVGHVGTAPALRGVALTRNELFLRCRARATVTADTRL